MDTKPYICTEQEKTALSFVEASIKLSEPCSVVGTGDMGQEVLYRELLQKLPNRISHYRIISSIITSADDIKHLDSKVMLSLPQPTLVLVNIVSPEDISCFIDTCNALRLKHSTSFMSIVISDIKSLYSALESHKKFLARSLFTIRPLDDTDMKNLVKSFTNRFAYAPTPLQEKQIISLSTGYIGLAKSLYLLQKQNPTKELTLDWILQEESVVQRLATLANQFPLPVLKSLLFNPTDLTFEERALLDKFGYTREEKLINLLLEKFLQKTLTHPTLSLELLLSETEFAAFNFLKMNSQKIVLREEIAQRIWKENWQEKYSDWAIDQLIHQIREKLKKTNAPYEIVTKKGIGFYLLTKTQLSNIPSPISTS